MGRTGIIVTGIIAIVLVIGGIIAFGRKNSSSTNTSTSVPTNSANLPPTTADNSSTGAQPAAIAATITYSDSGFSPSTITVNSGDTIAIKNTSSTTMQFQSNPHPIHTDDPELNVGVINAGQTGTTKVTTKGTFGYHNHLNPSQTASIVVK